MDLKLKNNVCFPVDVILTLKNQNELDKLGSLFNHGDIIDALNILRDGEEAFEIFEKYGANVQKYFNDDVNIMLKGMKNGKV